MKRILLDFTLSGVRTALVHSGELIELIFDNNRQASVIGNIYAGIVEKVIPGQFAFVNAGLSRNCFLQLDNIRHLAGIKQGDSIVIQAAKDENQTKGVFATTEISLAGRYIILMKSVNRDKSVAVSLKIEEKELRKRLKAEISCFLPEGYNVILRTQSGGAEIGEIEKEMASLHAKLKGILEKSNYIKAPALLYSQSTIKNTLELFLADDIDEIIINSAEKEGEVKEICRAFLNGRTPAIRLHKGDVDLFAHYCIETQIDKALNEKVWLKSGGFLLINETKACSVIDVNTGKFTSGKNREKVVVRNNLEAAKEIAKQIRLRNLSGMILIDFVDLDKEEEKIRLLDYLEGELKKDRIVANIADYSSLSIVQLTRKKTRPPLSGFMRESCPVCHGEGLVPRADFIGDNIYRKVRSIVCGGFFNHITIKSNENIITYLQDKEEFDILCKTYNTKIFFSVIATKNLDYYEIEKERRSD